jgi:ABC-type multidrug transport system fused ATPase/permease subunit
MSTILRSVLAAGKQAAAAKKAAAGAVDPLESASLNATSLSRLMALLRPEAPKLAAAVGTLGVTTGISLIFPLAIGRVLDVAITADAAALSPTAISAGLLGLFVVQSALIVTRSALLTIAGERLSAGIRRDLFKGIFSQDLAWFDKSRTGDVINRLSADTSALQSALTTQVAQGLRSLAMVVGGTGMLIHLSPSLAALSLVLIPPVAGLGMIYGRYVQGQSKAVQEALGRTMEVAEELVSNVRTVRAFAAERAGAARFDVAVQDSYRLARRIGVVAAWFDGGVHFAANAGLIAVLWYGGSQISSGAMSAGDLTAFLMYSLYMGVNLASLSRIYTDLKRAAGVAQRIFEICETPVTIPLSGSAPSAYWTETGASTSLSRGPPTELMRRLDFAAGSTPSKSARRLETVRGDVVFDNVTFSYPTRPEAPVLRGLSLTLPAGKHLAVVGSSGTGKSTLGAMLTRLYDPSAENGGSITLDGVNIRELDPSWLRSSIAVVSQEPALFATSIAENIRYGRPEATFDDIVAAAAQANAHDFVRMFPAGYETLVGERGAQLSGGQKQRIAIARAIIKDARVLILDEATSALVSGGVLQRPGAAWRP